MSFAHRTTAALTTLAIITSMVAPVPLRAGHEIESAGDKKVVTPVEREKFQGNSTLGARFNEGLGSFYLDGIMPLWQPENFLLFLDTRTTLNTDTQRLGSYGLAGRYMLPDQNVIIGGNIFYDSLDSRNSHHYDQLGLGVEILTKWVDARFNYYMPDDGHHEIGRTSRSRKDVTLSRYFYNRIAPNTYLLQRNKTTRTKTTTKIRQEYALEGWNAEVGFLVPGLDEYMELRLFAGAYSYGEFTGFKARAEARFLPGVVAGVEYWQDEELMGGNWTGEFAVTVPFSIFNLAKGRNPFEGFTESFRPRKREFSERMGDMIRRSHIIMTTDNFTQTTTTNTKTTSTVTEGVNNRRPPGTPVVAGPTPPPQVGLGEGGEGG